MTDILINNFLRSQNQDQIQLIYSTKMNDEKSKSKIDVHLIGFFDKFSIRFSDGDGVDPHHLFSNQIQNHFSNFASFSPLFSV